MTNKHLKDHSLSRTSPFDLPRKLGRKSAAYISKNYAYLQKDPNFFLMKTVARFEVARDFVARNRAVGGASYSALGPGVMTATHELEAVVSTLRTDGYYVGLQLSTDALASLLSHCHSTPCFADRDPNLPFLIAERGEFERALGRPIKLGSYFKQQESWPVFQVLQNDPLLQAISTAYLGRTPVYVRSELAWSFPYAATAKDRRAAAQVLHCDINDYRTIKFFFYLTDVSAENGPHAYIKKSPLQRSALHQLLGQRCASLSEDDLMRKYGKQLVTVCGSAGSGFAGDPYYFHRGTTPVRGERLLLQIEFGCRRYRTWYFDV